MDRSGVVWIPSETYGIDYFDFNKSKFSIIRNDLDDPNTMMDVNMYGVCPMKDQYIWIANAKGLYLFDRKNKDFTFYPLGWVIDVYMTDDNELWVAPQDNLMRYRFNPTDKSLKLLHNYSPQNTTPETFPGWFITKYIGTTMAVCG
ncbi:MAG: hypothetical protein HC896_09330 [Bacteroidales bacterium]|nr:hypothetical protein [Bacteroidales bacterium]